MAKQENTQFSAEQLDAIQGIVAQATKRGSEAFSVYDAKDPTTIETVNVKRYDGMYVLGYKDLNKDPLKKPRYYEVEIDLYTKKNTEWVTLLLADGKEEKEMKVRLSDLMAERGSRVAVPVLDIKVNKIIDTHGTLGSSSMARAVDQAGRVESRPTTLAQTKREERLYTVQLDGFDAPVTLEDYVLA